MFSISPAEFVTIVLVALIVFGPKRLPDIARKAGKIASQLRSTADEFRSELGDSYQETVEPFREAATEIAAAGKSLKETAEGELKWVDETVREASATEPTTENKAETEVETGPDTPQEPTPSGGNEGSGKDE